MITIDKQIPMRIRKDSLYYPMNTDRYHGSVVFVLSPDMQSTLSFLKNNKFLVNPNTFISYYIEKNFNFIIQEADKYVEEYGTKVKSVLEGLNGWNSTDNDDFILEDGIKYFYPDTVENIIFSEDFGMVQNYTNIFRNLLYDARIQNQKEVMDLYDKVKSIVPFIKYTFLNLDLYKRRNLIVDWSLYMDTFMKNNWYTRDRGIDLLHHFINRFIKDKRLAANGYTKKTVFVPVNPWNTFGDKIWNLETKPNIFSMIDRLVRQKKDIYEDWKDITFVFCTDREYFIADFKDMDMTKLIRFRNLVESLMDRDITSLNMMDTKGFAGSVDDDVDDDDAESSDASEPEEDEVDPETKEDMQRIKDAIIAVSNDSPEPTKPIKISTSRKERLDKLNKDFMKQKFGDRTIQQIIDESEAPAPNITKDTIPIDSLNDEWNDVTFTNFDKEYNLENDIVSIVNQLSSKSNPISVISMDKVDSSTHEDFIDTYIIKTEDANGVRAELKIDMPKFIGGRYMKLRGNLKVLNGQLFLMPIIKTAEDTVQIVTNYNKIFVYRISPSNGSKGTKGVNKLVKALKKYEGKKLSIYNGDNSFICSKYDLPVEYRDLAGIYSRIKVSDGSYITFNMDEAKKDLLPLVDKTYNKNEDTILGYDKKEKKVILAKANNIAKTIGEFLASKDPVFAEQYAASRPTDKLAYSEASILACRIPLIIVMAFAEGLETAMKKAGIKYTIQEKRTKTTEYQSIISFSDGYLVYNDEDPADSLLMSGLNQADMSEYSIADINKKDIWMDALDDFGGRLRADGLENFKDCLFDPMTISICKRYNLPYEYVDALAYANKLLADTNYNKHTDITGNRLRTNEVIAGYLYKAITKAYGDYANKLRHGGKGAKISIKQSAVIDNILLDPGCSDLSILNPLLEAEAAAALSFKGLSGMNSDRSYTLDKRVYDKSMAGVVGMSTGFSGNTGITRQSTLNSQIIDTRGTIANVPENRMNTLNMLTIYEAMAPFSTTHDDPQRTAMGYLQTVKHQMRVKKSSPNLITYGADEALPYMTSNIFSYKFKGKKGKIIEVTDDYIVYKNLDDNTNHIISLKEQVMKNSDGGFYVTVKLDCCVKKGQIIKYNDILAYDKSSYSKANATSDDQNNIAYNIGTLAKIAVMCTDEAYEDSSIINERLSDALTSSYCVKKEKVLKADTNVYNIVKPGQPIKEGDSLMVFQNSFDDKDANALLRNITDDEIELVSDFGRIKVRSKLTGIVQDVKIYRTCEISDLSPSLQKIVKEYESNIRKQRNLGKKFNISDEEMNAELEPDYKLDQQGKLKITKDGVLIEFYVKCYDKMGVGDKLVYNTAIKGVIKDIMPEGEEPYTDFRPNEKIDGLLTTSSINARMVGSCITSGTLNKILIELTRQCKDILGIKWDYLNND